MLLQSKLTYSPPGKALEKLTKAMEDEGEKPIKGLKKHGKQMIMSSSEKSFFKTFKTKRNSC